MNAPAELSLSQFRHVDDKSRLLTKSPHYGKFFEIYESMLEADFVKRGIKELEERMWDELKRRIKTENFATDLLTAGTQQQFGSFQRWSSNKTLRH